MAFGIQLAALLVEIIVGIIVVSPILWIVGRSIAGGQKAKFTDAIWIVTLGIIINTLLGAIESGILGLIVTLLVWTALIKHFFDTGWGKALVVGVIAIVALGIIVLALGLLALHF